MFKRSLLAAAMCTGAFAGAAAPALAAAPLAVTVPSAMPLAAVGISEIACQPAPPAPGFAVASLSVPASASAHPLFANTSSRLATRAAIMGGQLSALDRMRMEQAGVAAPAVAPATPQAAAMSAANAAACAAISGRPAERFAEPFSAPVSTGQFLGTERVRIGRTRYDAEWKRVNEAGLSRREVRRAVGKLPRERTALLARVNRWVNKEIAYRDDRVANGMNDYWADAKATLDNRTGDCEDYAILKMQMLAASGIDREDMMLTLARDTLKRSDHAVLLVRNGDEWVMLDMASDRIAPATHDYGYRAVMSFAANQRYIHGQKVSLPPQRIRIAYN